MKRTSRDRKYKQRIRNGVLVRLRRIVARQRIPKYQQDLSDIITRHPEARQTVVFPSGLGWYTHLFQRPQQLALALARLGTLVFYQEPELSAEPDGIAYLENNLYLCRVPVQTFQILNKPLIYCLTWNRKYLEGLPGHRLHYDFVDDLSAFEGNPTHLAADHYWLLNNANLVTATAERLYAQVRSKRPDALLLPNGVDYNHFSPSRLNPAPTPPAALAPLVIKEKPLIGYYGALSRWFDYDLLKEVAKARPELTFVLIGPDYDGSLPHSGVFQLPNIHWLGQKKYTQLPIYLAHFAVAIIPFKLEALTHATSPLKLYEYMAGAKPVVATPMEESARIPGVLTASAPADFAKRLDEALALRQDPDYMALIDQVARDNTWQARARTILAQV